MRPLLIFTKNVISFIISFALVYVLRTLNESGFMVYNNLINEEKF